MRVRVSWILLACLAWIGFHPGVLFLQELGAQLTPGVWTEKLREQTTRSSTFVLSTDRYVTLALPPEQGPVRFLTNASLPKEIVVDAIDELETKRWAYRIEYRFLDRRYDAIDARTYDFRTNCVLQRDRKSGEFFSNTFFASRQIIPGTTRPMVVNPNQIPDAATYIQLRVVGKAEEIQDVVVRSYVPMDVANRRVQKWKRLSPARRRQLARANVYPPVLLRDDERKRLMDNQWSLVLPEGVAGSDYHTRKLYTLKESDGQKVYRHALPYGLAIANGARGSVPVPDEKGSTQVRFSARESSTFLEPINVDVVYYPADRSGPKVDTITLQNNRNSEFTLVTNGGIIELISQTELSAQVFWRSSEQAEWIEITPEAERLHAYELSAGTDLIYSISHIGKLPTPIRLSFRNPVVSRQPRVQWELLDLENQVLSEGVVRVDGSKALFDRIINDARIEPVSSPVHRYVAASPQVAALRIRSLEDSVIVSAYTRPPLLPIERSVPRDYSAFERARVENDTWFLMWPVEASKGLQTKVVSILAKPPVCDEKISSGRFEWTDFDPVVAGPAKEILIPRADHAPVHSGTASFVYRQIQSGADVPLDVSDPARAPRLLFRAKSSPQRIRVFLDGSLAEERTLHTSCGSIYLPDVTKPDTSVARIETEDPDTELYLNWTWSGQTKKHSFPGSISRSELAPVIGHDSARTAANSERLVRTGRRLGEYSDSPQSPAFVKRLVHPIGQGESLSFKYSRSFEASEYMTIRFFRRVDGDEVTASDRNQSDSRFYIRVIADRRGIDRAFTKWTHLERSVTFSPPSCGGPRPVVLGSRKEQIDVGQAVFLPVGDDLAGESFTIEIRLDEGERGFVSLSQLRDAQPFKSRVTVE